MAATKGGWRAFMSCRPPREALRAKKSRFETTHAGVTLLEWKKTWGSPIIPPPGEGWTIRVLGPASQDPRLETQSRASLGRRELETQPPRLETQPRARTAPPSAGSLAWSWKSQPPDWKHNPGPALHKLTGSSLVSGHLGPDTPVPPSWKHSGACMLGGHNGDP